jgi:uncharacterized protein (DUF2164 family)
MKRSTAKRLQKRAKIWRELIANQVFNEYYYNRGLEETCRRIKLYRGVIQKYLNWIRVCYYIDFPNAKKEERKYKLSPHLPDYRKGDETYGYGSIESIENSLKYISDRFGAEFRLQWLLEVPERIEKLRN